MSLYLAAGLITEATVAGGELLHRFPDDKPTAEAVLHLLNHRLETIDGDYVVLGERGGRASRPPRRAPGLVDRLKSQRRVIRALIVIPFTLPITAYLTPRNLEYAFTVTDASGVRTTAWRSHPLQSGNVIGVTADLL